jgi:predicted DNA-binding transcriptional regulator AlpA
MLKFQDNPKQVPVNPLPDSKDKPRTPLVLEGFLRREELAMEFGLSTRTIDRLEAQRQGPPRVYVGRTILYKVESVREWLISREQKMKPAQRRRSSFSGLKSTAPRV